MLKHLETIIDMYDVTRKFRCLPELNAVWRTPEPRKCTRFACTECAEVVDIELREEDFARNSEKVGDYLFELADVGYMLCTALGPQFPKSAKSTEPFKHQTIDALMYRVSTANIQLNVYDAPHCAQTAILQALDIVCELFEQADADPVHYVRVKLERTYRKFVKSPDEIVDAVVTLEIDASHLIDYETLQDDYSGSLMDVVNLIGVWDAIDYDVDAYRVVKVSMK